MSDPVIPKTRLLHSLRRLARGLSALFWGLPLALLLCVETAVAETITLVRALPPLIATGLLFYGLLQLQYFQRQERIWQNSIEQAKLFALINVGLSPFIFFWNKLPEVAFFTQAVGALALSGLLFLFSLNLVLHRLTSMLPDATLRAETRLFTTLNRYIVFTLLALGILLIFAGRMEQLPGPIILLITALVQSRNWLMLFLVLLPLAMTMTLLWKTKEVVLESVFGTER